MTDRGGKYLGGISIITEIACAKVSKPAFTKETVITVVAEEL